MKKKPVIVITSAKAKDHTFKAHSLLEKMKNDMAVHSQNIAGEKRENKAKAEEQKRFDETNKSKMVLERLKKLL